MRDAGGEPAATELPGPALAHLTTLSALELRLEAAPEHRVSKLSALTPLQERAFELLGSKPHPAPHPEPIAAEPAEPSH